MLTITIVAPQDELGKDYLDREAITHFIDAKLEILGYGEASIHTPIQDSIKLTTAPYGSVKSDADGQALLNALKRIFPKHSFMLSTKDYPAADDIVWHERRMQN